MSDDNCDKFRAAVRAETPRLVVKFQRQPDRSEAFEWGIVGAEQIPPVSLIGCVRRTQGDLFFKALDGCPEQGLVLAWDGARREFGAFLHPDVPLVPLCGMLEIICSLLVSSRLAQRAGANRTALLGPDGQPFRRGM